MTKAELLQWFSLAVASMEGYFITSEQWLRMKRKLPAGWKPGDPITVAQRHFNPGNLRSWGKLPVVGNLAVFPDADSGWKALRRQIEVSAFGLGTTYPLRKTRPLTFFEFFAGQRDSSGKVLPGGYPGYAPEADNNKPKVYSTYVVEYLRSRSGLVLPEGLSINTVIRSLVQ